MPLSILTQWFAIAVTIIGGIIAWVAADTRAKARSIYTDEKLSEVADIMTENANRINYLETKMATSEQDRQDLHRAEQRLETTKASRDVVDGIKNDIQTLRTELGNRFDRVERLIELKTTPSR
tara:strand:+ start:1862 stop:2230 length:369 start_codon:yes stop_codon:yes gene_type:complete